MLTPSARLLAALLVLIALLSVAQFALGRAASPTQLNQSRLPLIAQPRALATAMASSTVTPTSIALPTQTVTQTTQPLATPTSTQPAQNCAPAYPTVCIPPPPPDLNCGDITDRRFVVLPPDPHKFDTDGDGVGCESG